MTTASVLGAGLSKNKKDEINNKQKPAASVLTGNEHTEENIYINSVVPVVEFESYVVKKKANEEEFSDEFKVFCRVSL